MTPPSLARRLVRQAVPPDAAGFSVIGDLQQEFDERAEAYGERRARRWYWRQALSIWWWAAWAHPDPSHHGARGGAMFDLMTDVRHAMRGALKAPGQTALIVAMLALAIGTTTVGFAFADLVVFRGLPVANPERTVVLFAVDPRTGNDRSYVTLSDFADFRARSQTTSALSALEAGRATLMDRGQASVLDVGRVSADYFSVFAPKPTLGRHFHADEDRPGAPAVVVLSHAYWAQVTGRDPAIIGRELTLNGTAHTVVGVTSPAMEFGTLAALDAWVPLGVDPAAPRVNRRVRVIGLLKPGVPLATAAAEFRAMGDALAAQYPETNAGWRARLAPISEAAGSSNLWLVLALFSLAVALVLAIACANIANVLLVRAIARRREVALRAALGATRFRIARQLVIEGLLLSAAGAALAVLVGQWMLRLIRSVDSQSGLQQLYFDAHEFGFVSLVAGVAPLLFALAPALHLARTDVRSELASGGVRTGSVRQRSRSTLVVMQIALAAVLLTISGLAVRTAINVARTDTGLQTAGVFKFTLEFDEQQYPDSAAIPAHASDLRARLAAIAGVRAVGVFDRLPVIAGAPVVSLSLDDAPPASDGTGPWALACQTQSGSLGALGIRVLAGRDLLPEETSAQAVALLGRDAAVRYFGSEMAALGRRITVTRGSERTVHQIVGVVTDTTSGDLELGMQPYVWLPIGTTTRRMGFAIAGAVDASMLAHGIRDAVQKAAPMLPVEQLESYDAAIARLVASDVVIIAVLAGFSLLALIMAAVGLYGIVAFSASQRRGEFGTRIALGASARDVMTLVLGHAGRLLGIGLAIGLVGGLLTGQAMRAALVGIGPLDPSNVAMVIVLLAAVTLLASVVPAIRASRVDLVQSLRSE